jgi:outer membrane receptor protein involved in Fe transport
VPYDRGTTESTEDQMSYNLSLLYQPSEDTSVYARAASGFRIGGVNNSSLLAASGGVTIPRTFGPDSLWSYELGAKTYFWNRRGFVDVAVYRIDWSDQQLNSTDSSGAFDFQINAGKTEINGVELQGSLLLVEGLTVGGGVVYTDATLAEDLPAGTSSIGFEGDQLSRVSEWAASLQAEYEWPMGGDYSGFAQLNGSYRGESATAFNPSDPNYLELDPYTVWDAAVGIRRNEWDARVFVRNLTDEAAQYAINVGLDGLRVYSPRPISVGVRVSGHF